MTKDTYDFLNQSYSGYLDYLFSDDSHDCPVTMSDDLDFSIEEFPEPDDYYPSEQFFYPTERSDSYAN